MHVDVYQTSQEMCPGEHTEIELGAGGPLTEGGGEWTASLFFSLPSWNHRLTANNPKSSCQMLVLSTTVFQVKTGRGQKTQGLLSSMFKSLYSLTQNQLFYSRYIYGCNISSIQDLGIWYGQTPLWIFI